MGVLFSEPIVDPSSGKGGEGGSASSVSSEEAVRGGEEGTLMNGMTWDGGGEGSRVG